MSLEEKTKETVLAMQTYLNEFVHNIDFMSKTIENLNTENCEFHNKVIEDLSCELSITFLLKEKSILLLNILKVREIITFIDNYDDPEKEKRSMEIEKLKKKNKRNWKNIGNIEDYSQKKFQMNLCQNYNANYEKNIDFDNSHSFLDFKEKKIDKKIKKNIASEASVIIEMDQYDNNEDNDIFFEKNENNITNFFEFSPTKSIEKKLIFNQQNYFRNENNVKDEIDYVEKKEKYNIKKEKRGPYKILDVDTKEKVLEEKYEISKKNLKRWLSIGVIRQKGGGRKILDPDMENKLLNWWIDCVKAEKKAIPLSMVKKKARTLSNHPSVFKASKGWLDKFSKRYKVEEKIEKIIQDNKELQIEKIEEKVEKE